MNCRATHHKIYHIKTLILNHFSVWSSLDISLNTSLSQWKTSKQTYMWESKYVAQGLHFDVKNHSVVVMYKRAKKLYSKQACMNKIQLSGHFSFSICQKPLTLSLGITIILGTQSTFTIACLLVIISHLLNTIIQPFLVDTFLIKNTFNFCSIYWWQCHVNYKIPSHMRDIFLHWWHKINTLCVYKNNRQLHEHWAQCENINKQPSIMSSFSP